MRALSLTQPWATLVAIGAKKIETRSWSTGYRGPVAIHAAKGFPDDCRALTLTPTFAAPLKASGLVTLGDLPRGAIVAVARIAHCFMTGDALNYRDRTRTMRGPNGLTYEMTPDEYALGDFSPGRYGWVLPDVVRLAKPIPCKGALGLWTVPDDVVQQLVEAVRP